MKIKKTNIDLLPIFLLLLNTIFATLLLEDLRSQIILYSYIVGVLVILISFSINGFRIDIISGLIFTLLFFIAFTIIFSSNKFISINYYTKMFLGMIMYPVLYGISIDKYKLKYFCIVSLLILLWGGGQFIYANIQGIGREIYSEGDIHMGYALLSVYYTYILAIFTTPLFIYLYDGKKNKKLRYLKYVSIVVISIVLILTFRRSNILLLVVGSLIYSTLSGNVIKTYFKNIIIGFGLVLILMLTFQDTLTELYEVRQSTLEVASVQNESRFLENIYIYETISQEPITLIFGSGEPFNSKNKYGFSHDRQIHNSYGNIFWSGGIVGLILYISIYAMLLIKFWKFRKIHKHNGIKFTLSNIGITLIMISFLAGFGSGLTSITFNGYSFGALGLFTNYIKDKK